MSEAAILDVESDAIDVRFNLNPQCGLMGEDQNLAAQTMVAHSI